MHVTWRQLTTSFGTTAYATLGGSITHSDKSAIHPFPYAWAHRYPWLASITIIDKGERICHPSLPKCSGQFCTLLRSRPLGSPCLCLYAFSNILWIYCLHSIYFYVKCVPPVRTCPLQFSWLSHDMAFAADHSQFVLVGRGQINGTWWDGRS